MSSKSITDNVQQHLLCLLCIFLTVFSFYAVNSYRLGFVYDDHEQIIARTGAPQSINLKQIFFSSHYSNRAYYRPLSRLSLDLQTAISGKWPAGYHLFSSFLGAVLAVVLFRLFRIMIPEAETLLLSGAVICTALHPVFSSCVFMISAQETLLAGIFIICGSIARLKKQPFVLALMTLLALFCRENAVSLPLLLSLAFFAGTGFSAGAAFKFMLPSWIVTGIYLLLRHQAISSGSISGFNPAGPLYSFIYLLQTIFLPEPGLVYEPPAAVWFSPFSLLPATLAICALYKADLMNRGKGHGRFWAAWLLIMFLPTSNLIEQQTPFDERHNLIILPVFTFLLLFFTDISARRHRKAAICMTVLMIMAAGSISHYRAGFFRDDFAFASQWLKTNPEAGEAYAIFGRLFLDKGQKQQAVLMFEQSVRFRPDMASSHDNLGYLYAEDGDPGRARECFMRAVSLDPVNSVYRYNLGLNLRAAGMYTSGYTHISLASLFSDPGSSSHAAVGQLFTEMNHEIMRWMIALTNPIL